MIKKSFQVTSVALLVVAMITGCSSSPVNSVVPESNAKVESVNVAQLNTVDLGNKNGASITTKLNLSGNKPSFGIKAITDAFDGYNSVDCVLLKLNQETTLSNPVDRFTDYSGATKAAVLYTGSFSGTPRSITFSGLKRSANYSISARAYKFAKVADGNVLDVTSNTLTVTHTGSLAAATPQLGDLVKVVGADTRYYEVKSTGSTSGSDTTYTVAQVGPVGTGGPVSTSLLTSAISNDGSGTDLSNPNSTAGARGDSPALADEEWVNINSSGTLALINDNGNETWDINLQLQKNTNASVSGSMTISEGDNSSNSDPESIGP